jgi:anti-anti-sigma regulatory factor
MQIETYEYGKFQIIKMHEENNSITDLSELRDLVNGYVNRGKYNIAISFTGAKSIYSKAIEVLISCYKRAHEKDGQLFIIEPDPALFEFLETLNLNHKINIYVSEKYLPQ